MIPALLDGTGNLVGDVAVTVVVTIAALSTYIRIGFDYRQRSFVALSMLTAIGFTILAIRMWTSIFLGIDITIAPASQIGMTLLCVGYSGTQFLAVARMREVGLVNVRCMRDGHLPCMREDRVRAAIQELRRAAGSK